MNKELIAQLIELTQPFKEGIKWVQSAGGNTSVKDEDGNMLIKASGFRLSDINEQGGYVNVNYSKAREYFKEANPSTSNLELIQGYKPHITSCIQGDDTFLPSMETGFHAVLKNYVVHTHPILLNAMLCSEDGVSTLRKIFPKATFIPYVTPGYDLSKAISDSDQAPIILLENHGLITHSNDLHEAVDLHQEVIQKLPFAGIKLPNEPLVGAENRWSNGYSEELLQFFGKKDLNYHIFPDQTVFLHGKVSINDALAAVYINLREGKVIYNMPEKKAVSVNEVLLSVLWVLKLQNQENLKTHYLSQDESALILGLDMEKYRQSL